MQPISNSTIQRWHLSRTLAIVAILSCNALCSDGRAPLSSQVDAYIQPYVASNNFSGVILIAREGKILVNQGYGLANRELAVANTPDTRFHIASVSKSFTAAAILVLEQRGKLSVKDPLSKFIPDYPNGDKITIHHLLTHTSGIANANNLPQYDERSKSRLSLNDVIAMFKNQPPEFEPGTKFRYSNSNYNLLAYIIEKTSGQNYGDFLRENIFTPLDMRNTADDSGTDELILNRASGYVPVGLQDVKNAPYLNWSIKKGNGSLYSTVGDLYKWDRAVYTDKILSPSSREKMFPDYGGFGYGWFVRKQNGRPAVIINGRSPGFTSSLQRFVDDDVCIVLLANTYSGLTQALADDLAALVFGQKVTTLQPLPKISRDELDQNVGTYQFGQDFSYNPNATVRIKSDGADLAMSINNDDTYLLPQSGGKFLDRLYGGVVQFIRDPQGHVTALSWSFGQPFIAKKTAVQ
jgi:CubicO group peptidase (beta-lactamase class C family)